MMIISVDHGYFGMKKYKLQEAATTCFELMDIQIAQRLRKPILAFIHRDICNWLGFIKVHLLNSHTNGIALLKDERIFTIQLQNSEYIITKVEKEFEIASTAVNGKLKIKSLVFNQFSSRDFLGELIKLEYLFGANLEFIDDSKKTQ